MEKRQPATCLELLHYFQVLLLQRMFNDQNSYIKEVDRQIFNFRRNKRNIFIVTKSAHIQCAHCEYQISIQKRCSANVHVIENTYVP